MLTILTLAGALALTPPTLPQVDEERPGPPLVSVEDLQLLHYTPQYVSAYELFDLAQQMVGRSLFVQERGGYTSQPVSNMSVLGDSLVLYDTKPYVERLLKSLTELDQPGSDPGQTSSVALSTLEYTPRFVSVDMIQSALNSFRRAIVFEGDTYDNVSFVRERGLLVVRETKERLEEIEELLERIDTPKPQVLLTCHLLRRTEREVEASNLPAELVENLAKLVPGTAFEAVGFGMLQSAVVPNTMVSLKLDTTQGESFELSFSPVALDRASSALSVANCTLMKDRRGQVVGDGRIRIFSTDTLFRGNEYTVLGASGMDPIFVVVRVAPVGI